MFCVITWFAHKKTPNPGRFGASVVFGVGWNESCGISHQSCNGNDLAVVVAYCGWTGIWCEHVFACCVLKNHARDEIERLWFWWWKVDDRLWGSGDGWDIIDSAVLGFGHGNASDRATWRDFDGLGIGLDGDWVWGEVYEFGHCCSPVLLIVESHTDYHAFIARNSRCSFG